MKLFKGLFSGSSSQSSSSSGSSSGTGDATVDFVDVTVDSSGETVVTPGTCSTDEAIDYLANGEPIQ